MKKQASEAAARKIRIEFVPNNKEPKAGGIYRLLFGKRYYIGRTRCIYSRRYNHVSQINSRLNGNLNDAMIDPELDMYKHVIAYLNGLKKLPVVKMEILSYHDTDDELVNMEQRWLNKSNGDRLCLNFGFIAKPYKEERKKESYKVIDLRHNAVKKRVEVAKKIKTKRKKQKKQKNIYAGLTTTQRLRLLRRVIKRLEQ